MLFCSKAVVRFLRSFLEFKFNEQISKFFCLNFSEIFHTKFEHFVVYVLEIFIRLTQMTTHVVDFIYIRLSQSVAFQNYIRTYLKNRLLLIYDPTSATNTSRYVQNMGKVTLNDLWSVATRILTSSSNRSPYVAAKTLQTL